ncbi:MAG: TolC family protein [Verrucomicrobiota bacterium]
MTPVSVRFLPEWTFLKKGRSLFLWIIFTFLTPSLPLCSETSPTPPSLTLEDFLKSGINHHPDVEQARTVIKDAKGNEFVFWSTVLPNFNLLAVTAPTTLQASITQKLYDYGTPARYRAAQYTISAAKSNYELAVTEAVYAVREAYAQALLSQKSSFLIDSYARELEASLKTVDLQFEAGKLSKNEVERLYVRASLARQSAEAQKIDEQQRKENLFRLSGLPNVPHVDLKETENFKLPDILEATKLIEIAFQQRRDLYALENLKLANNEQIQILRSFNLPILNANVGSFTQLGSLGVMTGYHSTYIDSYKQQKESKTDFYSNMRTDATLSWRIFDGGQIRGGIKQAQAEVVKQETLLERTRINIPSQVKAALQLLTLAYDQWKVISAIDPQQALNASQDDFSIGKAKQLDLLDTQETVLTQRIQKAMAEANLSISKATLDRATGLSIRFVNDPSDFRK